MRSVLFLAFLPFLILVPPTRAEDPVLFADSVLKAAVEAELWIEDPTPTDMLQLISLEAIWQGIASMDGLEYATNLQRLVLNNNEISDISIVSGLTNLEHLDIHNNLISDISAVSGLTGLRTLVLRINQISDISALSGLTNLETLILRRNQIGDISALSALTEMRYLQLSDNQIGDISALAGLTNLETLALEHNLISDISALVGLTHLDTDPLFVRRGCWTDPDDPSVLLVPGTLHAVWAAGDYHLQSQGGRWDTETQTWVFEEATSPCIDAGDPLDSIGNEPYPNGGVINMGAYGGTSEAGKSS